MNNNNHERKHFRPTILVNSTKEISIKKAANMLKDFIEEQEKVAYVIAKDSSKEEQYQLPDTLKSNSKVLLQMMMMTVSSNGMQDTTNDEQQKKKEVSSKKRKKSSLI